MTSSGALDLFVRDLPIVIGAAVSPILVTVSILILSGGAKAIGKAWAFALGTAITTLAIGIPGVFLFTQLAAHTSGPDRMSAAVDVVAAVVLAALAVRAARKRAPDADLHKGRMQRLATARWPLYVGLGMVVMLTNVSSLVLYLPVLKGLARSDIPTLTRLVILAVDVVIILAPAWLPPVMVTIGGTKAQALLARLRGWLTRHDKAITVGVLVVFAVYLGYRGFTHL